METYIRFFFQSFDVKSDKFISLGNSSALISWIGGEILPHRLAFPIQTSVVTVAFSLHWFALYFVPTDTTYDSSTCCMSSSLSGRVMTLTNTGRQGSAKSAHLRRDLKSECPLRHSWKELELHDDAQELRVSEASRRHLGVAQT